jgi:hypothetical protein
VTDIGVFSQPFQTEDRSWLLSEFEDAYSISGTLDVTQFTLATHYPNGFIPSGTILGVVTATGLWGPYNDTAADGRQTAVGILNSAIRVLNPIGGALTKIGAAAIVYNAVISQSKLPFNSGNAATPRGYIDAAGIADLSKLLFLA